MHIVCFMKTLNTFDVTSKMKWPQFQNCHVNMTPSLSIPQRSSLTEFGIVLQGALFTIYIAQELLQN
jgi:hypothetical protein